MAATAGAATPWTPTATPLPRRLRQAEPRRHELGRRLTPTTSRSATAGLRQGLRQAALRRFPAAAAVEPDGRGRIIFGGGGGRATAGAAATEVATQVGPWRPGCRTTGVGVSGGVGGGVGGCVGGGVGALASAGASAMASAAYLHQVWRIARALTATPSSATASTATAVTTGSPTAKSFDGAGCRYNENNSSRFAATRARRRHQDSQATSGRRLGNGIATGVGDTSVIYFDGLVIVSPGRRYWLDKALGFMTVLCRSLRVLCSRSWCASTASAAAVAVRRPWRQRGARTLASRTTRVRMASRVPASWAAATGAFGGEAAVAAVYRIRADGFDHLLYLRVAV